MPVEELELVLGVLHLVERGLLEDLRDVEIAILARHLGEVVVLVARHALAGKRGLQVLFGLGHGCLLNLSIANHMSARGQLAN